MVGMAGLMWRRATKGRLPAPVEMALHGDPRSTISSPARAIAVGARPDGEEAAIVEAIHVR